MMLSRRDQANGDFWEVRILERSFEDCNGDDDFNNVASSTSTFGTGYYSGCTSSSGRAPVSLERDI